jgi:hypothetical protein
MRIRMRIRIRQPKSRQPIEMLMQKFKTRSDDSEMTSFMSHAAALPLDAIRRNGTSILLTL